MIQIFHDNFTYIEFITNSKIKRGEVISSSFIPSVFFTKDIINYFFDKKEHIPEHKEAAEKLWKFGREVLRALNSGKISIGMEFQSLKAFVEKGLVHEATSNFETSFATRIKVLDNILNQVDNLHFYSEPTPFVFRLVPPNITILDVDRNKTEQTIQGMSIKSPSVFAAFRREFDRLVSTSVDRSTIVGALSACKIALSSGVTSELKI